MRVAALDLGTNTFLLLVAEVGTGTFGGGQIHEVIHDEVRIVRLGQGVHESRQFHVDALKRADECLQAFGETARKLGAEKILACATSAARDVTNADRLVEICKNHGIPLKIITGEREAELTFLGTLEDGAKEPAIIIDVGGGSTELIMGGRNGIAARASADIGSVRLTELFVTKHPIPDRELRAMVEYIQDKLAGALAKGPFPNSRELIAVAGTPTTLATLDQGLPFESNRVHGYRISTERLRHWVETLARMTVEERQALAGMEPKRADVIVAGALILLAACENFRAEGLDVSVRGLRYGIARYLGAGGT